MKKIDKIEDIKCKNISSDEERNLINEETGNSLAWDILQLMGKSTRRIIVVSIVEGIALILAIIGLIVK